LQLRLSGNCTHGGHRIHEVVGRDALHVAGAHNSLYQSRMMDRGLQIVLVNGFEIIMYDNANTGHRDYRTPVANAPQVGCLFQFDVNA
jgi:hypothetical protein